MADWPASCPFEVVNASSPLTDQALAEAEFELQAELPRDYVQFLRSWNGGGTCIWDDVEWSLPGEETRHEWLTLQPLTRTPTTRLSESATLEVLRQWRGFRTDQFGEMSLEDAPIIGMFDAMGPVHLGVRGRFYGEVFVETERTCPREGTCVRLAGSFREFVESLKVVPSRDPESPLPAPFSFAFFGDHSSFEQALAAGEANARFENEPLVSFCTPRPSILRRLLQHGCRLDAVDGDGNTALHKAVRQHGPIESVELLLVHGARADIANHAGQTPLAEVHSNAPGIAALLSKACRL